MNKSYLDNISNLVISKSGVFKYVQIRLTCMGDKKTVVRGWENLEYHVDVYNKFLKEEGNNLDGIDSEVIGGGRINVNKQDKKVKVYGYSVQFGICDHSYTCELIKKDFSDYSVEYENSGY